MVAEERSNFWQRVGRFALSSRFFIMCMGAALQSHARMFMVPGMGHSTAGSGPHSFATLSALDSWVSDNVVPDALVAVNKAGRGMPLCKFPEQAKYVGGPVNSASSWACPEDDRRPLQIGPDGALAGAADR